MDRVSELQQRTAREVELKLELDADQAAKLRESALAGAAGCRSQDQLTVYYDTPGGTVRDQGFTLRVRSSGGKFVQTVKPITESAGLMAREEIECDVASIEPDRGALPGVLRPLVESREQLLPIIRSQVRRTSWTIDQGGGRIQVDLDEGEISAGDRRQPFNELEFELLSGDPRCLLIAAKDIADHVPVRLGVVTKAERGFLLRSGASHRITKAAPVEVHPGMTVAETFEVMVNACLKHYRLNEPLVIEGREAKALHQSRVAMRRLRSAFTLFKSAIADVEYHYLREELRWFTSQLGDARNLDVYLERDLPDDERERLSARRDEAYVHVIEAMNSPRLRRLMLELVGWLAFGPWRSSPQAQKPVGDYANRRLNRLWGTIDGPGQHLASIDEESRHQLRIQVKKMRYAIEFLRGLYPDKRTEEKRFAAAVEELQESLGKLNDLHTAQSLRTAPAGNEWLIGEPEERIHLRESEQAFRDLAAVGPFWRTAAPTPVATEPA